MNPQSNQRNILILVSAVDAILGAIILLSYFGLFPVDFSAWLGIQRWVVGVVGGVWFLSALGVLLYQLTRTET